MYVYVAGPYTLGDPVVNVRRAILVADTIMALGAHPFVPVLNSFWRLVSPKDYETWLRWCLAWVQRCDVLYRIEGESAGADREEALAKTLRIPVVRDLPSLETLLKKPCGHLPGGCPCPG